VGSRETAHTLRIEASEPCPVFQRKPTSDLIRGRYRFASKNTPKQESKVGFRFNQNQKRPWRMMVGCGGGLQMNFLTIGLDEEIPDCQLCGNKPRLICKTLDTKKGETVRVFLCKCGGTTRTSRDSHERSVQRQFG
jgi:hypothetical protein